MNDLLIKEEFSNIDLLFGQLWEISVDGMRLVDEDGNILLVNDSFCKIFQMEKEELLGKPFSKVYDKDEQEDALENAINIKNAKKIKARVVCELANGPTTPEADLILFKNNVHVIPDILASAGGVTVSYFEMVQDKSLFFWEEEEVHKQLDKKLTLAYKRVQEAIKEKKVHPRLAAMLVGVARVAQACQLRGWV